MLKKIVQLENLGRFTKFHAHGDVELRAFNLVYGGNGAGKSTISQVLRASKSGETLASYQKLGSDSSQTARLLLDTSRDPRTYRNGGWEGPVPDVEVFDHVFVTENVHVSGTVDTNHRRSVLALALGASEASVMEALNEVDGDTRDAARAAREATEELQNLAASHRLSVKLIESEYDAPGPSPSAAELQAKLEGLQSELKNCERSEEIMARSPLRLAGQPKLPDIAVIKELVERPMTSISESASQRLELHLAKLGEGSRSWVERGLGYCGDESDCPFCGQSTESVELPTIYREAFTTELDAYVQQLRMVASQLRSQVTLMPQTDAINTNERSHDFWKQVTAVDAPSIELAVLKDKWKAAIEVVSEWIDEALSDPTRALEVKNATTVSSTLQQACAQFLAYDSAVEQYNQTIAKAKSQVITRSRAQVSAEIAKVSAQKLAMQPEVQGIIGKIRANAGRREELQERKAELRRDLAVLQSSRVESFEADVNGVLQKLGTPFQISKLGASMPGGKPAAEYGIRVEGHHVAAGRPSTGAPGFDTLLSAGDKASLALAFFIAQLHRRDSLEGCTVVFDDPMSSLDEDRRRQTAELICDLGARGAQVVVLSHRPHFLKMLHDMPHGLAVKQLCLSRLAERFEEADLAAICRSQYLRAMDGLRQCADGKLAATSETRASMRTVLEEYLRMKFPHAWTEKEWLGGFLEIATEQNLLSKTDLAELGQLTTYSSPSHHASGSPHYFDSSEGEIRSYARRTYDFISRPRGRS